ncbi:MAG: hypothetical protein MJZ15_06230 [Bacteroidales bacterium]|nr:hypothetical protein [Bacteroidales bacterium]
MFEKRYSIDNESYCAAHVDKAITAHSPSLEIVCEAYGETPTITWLFSHLASLPLSTGVNKGVEITPMQITSMARTILANYPKLRVTSLLVFFSRFKAGYYDHFYGSFDPMVVTTALNEFVRWERNERNEILWRQARNPPPNQ